MVPRASGVRPRQPNSCSLVIFVRNVRVQTVPPRSYGVVPRSTCCTPCQVGDAPRGRRREREPADGGRMPFDRI
jgi:hypothetical protein